MKDFKNTSIAFDIYTSSEDVDVYLSNRNNTFFRSLQNTPIKTNQWQSIKVDFPYDIVLPTGDYRLLVLVGPSVLSEWWIDNVSISEKAVAWDGRAVVDDPWESNNAAWTPFKNALGGTSGVVFNQRGSELQIRGRGLSTDATISKIQIKPNYSELGRLNEFASPALVPPVANFTGTPTGLTVAFTSTAADGDGEIINQEWQFGDGSYGSGRTPSHTYASAGNYWVTLIVMDNQGNFDSYTDTVTV